MSDRRVLVVDDDPAIRDLVTAAFASIGHGVSAASNGRAALDLLEHEAPDVILLDMRMPVMDGWAFAQEYERRQVRHVPIIAFTAALDAPEEAAQVHAKAYLSKPFSLDQLFSVTEPFLH